MTPPAPRSPNPAPRSSSPAPRSSSPAPRSSSPAPRSSSPAPRSSSPASVRHRFPRRGWSGAWAVGVACLVAGALAPAATAQEAEDPAPVLHYTFDDDLDAVVEDSSGNGHDGTLANPGTATQVAGVDGQAVDLPGGAASSGAHVQVPPATLQGATDLTVSLRVEWDGGGNWQRLWDLGSGTARSTFTTPRSGDGELRTAITTGGGGAESQVRGSGPLSTDEWATVTMVLDTVADTITTYLDGAAIGSTSTSITGGELLTAGATHAGYVGRSFYNDPLLDGAIDDFRVYHQALSTEQVGALVVGDVPTAVAPATTIVEVNTAPGEAPDLPATIPATFTDGYDRPATVTWEAVDPADYATEGRFTVAGTVGDTAVTAEVRVVRPGTMSIDLGTDTGEFLGGASGTLYGLYDEGMPTDNLIEGFGLRTVATKGQDGSQHPGSDALEVLEPLARATDGKVYIRTTDWYRGFPYDWEAGDVPDGNSPAEAQAKVDAYLVIVQDQLDQVADLLAGREDLRDNVVIEPFNEPDGNMFGSGSLSYNGTSLRQDPTPYYDAWDTIHGMITDTLGDYGVEIAGPGSYNLYPQVRDFLVHTRDAGTLPDIITWHELSDPATVRESVDRFRSWEDEVLGADSDLHINVNEYAFNYHTSVPGQMIQWISAIEDVKVDAMIAFWNMNGNLSDSAVQTNRANGQWWLFNAYQSMTGHTVEVIPPQPGESYTLQGVATLDEEQGRAHALFGGTEGEAHVRFEDVPADVFGDEVRVTVREIPWTGQLGESPEPRHVLETTMPVTDGSVTLDFPGAGLPGLDEGSAYEVFATPAGTGATTVEQPLDVEATYEAEDAAHTGEPYFLNGPEGSPNNVGGFYTSGGRDVGGLRTGSTLQLDVTVEVPEDGTYDLQVFSSTLNTFAAVQEQGPTNVFVRVDGAQEQELFLPLTYKWVVWDHADTTVDLTAGTHTITLAAQGLDGGQTVGDAIVDRIVLQKPSPDGAATVYEAELAELLGASARYDATGDVSGAGVATVDGDDALTFWVNVDDEGEHTIDVDTLGGTATLTVNGIEVTDRAGEASAQVYLSAGVNKVVVTGSGVDVDRLVVEPTSGTLAVTTYEAEDGTLSGAAAVTDFSLASEGQAVTGVGGDPGNDNTLTMEVEATTDGLHAVTVRFSNPEQPQATHYNPNPMGRHADITVNGELVAEQVMFVPTFHENNFFERTILLDLAVGTNTITFSAEEETNWDGQTSSEANWPGLLLRAELAPIIDRLEVAPFAVVGDGESDWATDTSLVDLLGDDTSGPESPRRANGDDFDLLTSMVGRVLADDPGSPVSVLADPTRPVTAFLPDDDAILDWLNATLPGRVPNERVAAGRLERSFTSDEIEAVLLDHVVVDATLTSTDVLAMDDATIRTAGGATLTIRVSDGGVSLLDANGEVVAVLDPGRLDLNLGQVQVAHVVDRPILLD